MNEDRITFKTSCSGNPAVFHALGIPLSAMLEAELLPDGVEFHTGPMPDPLKVLPQPPQAAGEVIAAIIGVFAFLGPLAAKKVIDEIYSAKIGPKIRDVLDSTSAKLLPNKPGKKWLFQLGVWYEEDHVLILLTLVGDSLKEVHAQEHLLPTLHSQAVNWLIQNTNNSPVHLYIAEDGKANLSPLTFDHINEAQEHLKKCWPLIIPTPTKVAGSF